MIFAPLRLGVNNESLSRKVAKPQSKSPSMKFNIPARYLAVVAIVAILNLNAHGQRSSIQTIQFQSHLINATLPYNVILPPGYRATATTRYPVLYLLHGHGGHYTDWLTRTNIADYASQYRMIVVMPEGNNSWYVDGASGSSDKYESYILQELMPDVDNRYRTIQSRYGRGIAGLSMGGYGALKFGLKSPGMFAFAGSISGALAATTWTEDDFKALPSMYKSLLGVFGP